jgi:hypothetical protein
MAELIQLDAAARLAGKSEVTIRRAIKAGKLTAEKQKTQTGFIYLVDAAAVREVFGTRGAAKPAAEPAGEPEENPRHAMESQGKVRVAVSGITGNPSEYWAKRAETYEERYHHELQRNGQLREELGLWRGRAEHAQSLLMKLLPGPSTVEVGARSGAAPTPQAAPTRRLSFAGMIIVIALPLIILFGGAVLYLIRQ